MFQVYVKTYVKNVESWSDIDILLNTRNWRPCSSAAAILNLSGHSTRDIPCLPCLPRLEQIASPDEYMGRLVTDAGQDGAQSWEPLPYYSGFVG